MTKYGEYVCMNISVEVNVDVMDGDKAYLGMHGQLLGTLCLIYFFIGSTYSL